MALIDVKEYYYKMLNQYMEMKADLADFEQALKDGHITEDQLLVACEDVAEVEKNYNRLTYIMFLYELPKTKRKRAKFFKNKSNADVEAELTARHADVKSVIDENESVLTHLREELKRLKDTQK